MSKVKEYLKTIDEVIENGKFKDNWESLSQFQIPEWYQNAKFGIFIHWGLYSVPAFEDEWYARKMYLQGTSVYEHHIKTYGTPDKFGYKDFIPMFKADKFDAGEWASLFEEAGAKYVMPVAEHHDGFQMYSSDLNRFNSVEMGPGRDILGELSKELALKNIVFAASSHRAEHLWFLEGGRDFRSDLDDPEYREFYWPSVHKLTGVKNIYEFPNNNEEFLENWLARTCEIVDRYRPKIMYFDWWIQNIAFKRFLKKFAAYYYNRAIEWNEQVAINYKFDAFAYGTGVMDIERGQMSGIQPLLWQNDTSVAKNSWGYTEGNDYKNSDDIICDLIDAVSKNGCLLLNIGPKSDGTIPDEDANILRNIGKWLKTNGEGIYGAKCWRVFGEGPTEVTEGHFTDTMRKEYTSSDIRFTYKSGKVYAFVLKWPDDGIVKIKSFKNNSKYFTSLIKSISIPGYNEQLQWLVWDEALTVKAEGFRSDSPVCIKITIE